MPGGDLVPEWTDVGLSAAMLASTWMEPIKSWWRRRAAEFDDDVRNMTEMSDAEIVDVLESDEIAAEVLTSARLTAMRTVDEVKRKLLARVAAASIKGEEQVKVDLLPLFVHTLDVIEPPAMKLLEVMRGAGGTPITREGTLKIWPGVEDTFEPLVASLEGQGLVAVNTALTHPGWYLSPYGLRFDTFVRTGLI